LGQSPEFLRDSTEFLRDFVGFHLENDPFLPLKYKGVRPFETPTIDPNISYTLLYSLSLD
jgi:hypothetical protein